MCLLFFIKFLFFTKNYEKWFLFHLKSSFRSQNIQIFALSSSPPIFPSWRHWSHSRKKITVYFISFSGWLAKCLTKCSPWCIQGMEIGLWAYIYQNISICWKVILWLSCEILTLNIHKTPDSDFFLLFPSIFGLRIRYFGLL